MSNLYLPNSTILAHELSILRRFGLPLSKVDRRWLRRRAIKELSGSGRTAAVGVIEAAFSEVAA